MYLEVSSKRREGKAKEIEVEREILCFSCSVADRSCRPRKTCERCGGAGQVQIGLPPSTLRKRAPLPGQAKIPSHRAGDAAERAVDRKKQVSVQFRRGSEDCRIFCGEEPAGRNGGASGDLVTMIK